MKRVGSSGKKKFIQSSRIGMAEAVVAGAYGMALKDMRARSRKHTAQEARQVAAYLARVVLGVSFRELAQQTGRSPGTAFHACKKVEQRRDEPEFDRTVDFLEHQLRSLAGVRP